MSSPNPLDHTLEIGEMKKKLAEAIHQKAKDYPEIDKIFSEQVKTRLGWVNDVANNYFRELRAPIG